MDLVEFKKKITKGAEFVLFSDYEKQNCIRVSNSSEIPLFLSSEFAAIPSPDSTALNLYSLGAKAQLKYPVNVRWEEMSEENKNKYQRTFACYPYPDASNNKEWSVKNGRFVRMIRPIYAKYKNNLILVVEENKVALAPLSKYREFYVSFEGNVLGKVSEVF